MADILTSGGFGASMVETDKAPAFGDAIRLQLLIDAVVDYAIFQLDESGRIATWNTGAQRIKGYTESEIIGKHLSTFYTEEDQKSGVPQRALETAGQTGKYEAEGWRVRKDGTKFWALVVIDAIRDQETGKLIEGIRSGQDENWRACLHLG
jgi:PAS domain S-box-containing protein